MTLDILLNTASYNELVVDPLARCEIPFEEIELLDLDDSDKRFTATLHRKEARPARELVEDIFAYYCQHMFIAGEVYVFGAGYRLEDIGVEDERIVYKFRAWVEDVYRRKKDHSAARE